MILALGLTILLLSLLLVIYLPRQQAKKLKESTVEKKLEFENETRRTMIQILGGIAFISTFYFSYKTYILSNEQQITNRFTETIKLLSNENKEIRIGALYALERLSKDSEKDKISILQIINAYVRNHAPRVTKDLFKQYIDSAKAADDDEYSCSYFHPSNKIYVFHPDTTKQELDIQVAITILGTNNFGLLPLNFTNLDFRAINFRELNLSNSDFSYCDLTSDDFGKAVLDSCKFDRAVANKTIFATAKIRKSSFATSLLQEANFYQADLSNSHFSAGSCCYDCQFGEAIFRNGDIRSVDLRRALFWDADLTNIFIEFAPLDSINLDRTILNGADLRLTRGLAKSEISKAKTDKTTKLP